MTLRKISRSCGSPFLPIVRVAQPMPAQLTRALSGPISTAASTPACTWSVSRDVGGDEDAADLLGERVALLLLAVEVHDHDLHAFAARSREVASPRPEAPPVTIADDPVISMARQTRG